MTSKITTDLETTWGIADINKKYSCNVAHGTDATSETRAASV